MKEAILGRPDKVSHICIQKVTVMDLIKFEPVERMFMVITPAESCIGYPRQTEHTYRIGERITTN